MLEPERTSSACVLIPPGCHIRALQVRDSLAAALPPGQLSVSLEPSRQLYKVFRGLPARGEGACQAGCACLLVFTVCLTAAELATHYLHVI